MNDCKFSGRFASKPRRADTSNASKCYFTLITNREGKRPDGTKYPPLAVDFVAWGGNADIICKYKDKGHLVLVTAEFGYYEKSPVDMNNNPIENARKVQKSLFKVKSIEFMPVTSNGQTNQNSGQNALVDAPEDDILGDVPFDVSDAKDIFDIGRNM